MYWKAKCFIAYKFNFFFSSELYLYEEEASLCGKQVDLSQLITRIFHLLWEKHDFEAQKKGLTLHDRRLCCDVEQLSSLCICTIMAAKQQTIISENELSITEQEETLEEASRSRLEVLTTFEDGLHSVTSALALCRFPLVWDKHKRDFPSGERQNYHSEPAEGVDHTCCLRELKSEYH